jgi:CubicO group peptidase (beta-lactamase class C family)
MNLSNASSGSWDTRIAGLEDSILELLEEHDVPGLSIAIIRDAKVAWGRGFGVKDSESNEPVDSGTIFEAASMSKPVFAYAVMKLCERGVLGLDTPLTEYTPDRFLEADPRLGRITARHVLSHTSGFQDIRSREKPLKIHFEPGEKWQYSGEGYAYLQSVVAALVGRVDERECSTYEADSRVCATDFDAYMRTNLLAPFGMNSSGYVWKEEFAKDMTRPHDEKGARLAARKYTAADAARYGSMGGLLTTAADYAKFLIEIVDPQPADAFRLTEAGLKEMLRPRMKVEDGAGYSISWALGWKIAQTAEHGELVSHGGDQMGYHCIAEISVAQKSGYAILTNGENGWKTVQAVARSVGQWVHEPSRDTR